MKEASRGGRILAEFQDPYHCYAVAEPISPESLPAKGDDAVADAELYIWFMPGGSATPFEVQKRGEAWMESPSKQANPTIEVLFRSDRIFWRPGRALINGAADRVDETIEGLVEFAFHEGELRRLEREIDADWSTAEGDIPLTHSVDGGDLRRQGHVDEMTQKTTIRRMHYARLERRMEKPALSLPGASRRLVNELALQAEILERFKSLSDRLEVYEDLYESANDRLSEYRYYRGEFWLEIWIIVVLFLEVVLMLLDLFRW